MSHFIYHDLGRIEYEKALERQTASFNALLEAKAQGRTGENRLFFCEHQPVLTIGKSGKDTNLLIPEELLVQRGVSFYHINRGGDITYHGPGQITGYPVFDLDTWKLGLKQYIDRLEETIIRFLAIYGIKGERLAGATGVWIDPDVPGKARKICAIGVKSSRFVTMHGFALNINTNLDYFSLINPCGFKDKGVTSLEKELGAEQDFEAAKACLHSLFIEMFPECWSRMLFISLLCRDIPIGSTGKRMHEYSGESIPITLRSSVSKRMAFVIRNCGILHRKQTHPPHLFPR